MKIRTFIILMLVINPIDTFPSTSASKQPDGTIVSEKPWDNVPEHFFRSTFSRIRTMSDGLEVVALLGKPQDMIKGKKYPVVIYNRGGNREFGKIEEPTLLMHELIKSGYIILASQYRGNDGSQGVEQFGGDDVHDVLNLIKTAQNLPYADTNNIFMIGRSRGGMMTYVALKEQPPIKRAVVIAGPTDLFKSVQERPEMETYVYNQLIPNLPENREEEYKKRSVVFWPEKINVPILIIHGKNDWRVDVSDSHAIVEKLKQLNKKHLYLEHDNGIKDRRDETGHSLPDEMIKDVINWIDGNHSK